MKKIIILAALTIALLVVVIKPAFAYSNGGFNQTFHNVNDLMVDDYTTYYQFENVDSDLFALQYEYDNPFGWSRNNYAMNVYPTNNTAWSEKLMMITISSNTYIATSYLDYVDIFKNGQQGYVVSNYYNNRYYMREDAFTQVSYISVSTSFYITFYFNDDWSEYIQYMNDLEAERPAIYVTYGVTATYNDTINEYYNNVSSDEYLLGYNSGYNDAVNTNNQNAYNSGYATGYETGYNNGLNDQEIISYDEGYEKGKEDYAHYDSDNDTYINADTWGNIRYNQGINNDFDYFAWMWAAVTFPAAVLNIELFPGVKLGYIAMFGVLMALIGLFFRLWKGRF